MEELLSISQMSDLLQTNQYFGLVYDVHRIGVLKFSTRLEYEHYSPLDEELNSRFNGAVLACKDGSFEIHFFVIAIPIEDRHLAEKIAKECGLRFADGVPTILSGNKVIHFPIQHKNMCSIEYATGSDAYDPVKAEKLKKDEEDWLDNFWENQGE